MYAVTRQVPGEHKIETLRFEDHSPAIYGNTYRRCGNRRAGINLRPQTLVDRQPTENFRGLCLKEAPT